MFRLVRADGGYDVRNDLMPIHSQPCQRSAHIHDIVINQQIRYEVIVFDDLGVASENGQVAHSI
jgi:hypothetical protein